MKLNFNIFAFVFGLIILFSFFGAYDLQKAVYVDEPLWLYDRIPKFWQNIFEKDANGTRRSDKPGVSIMTISGIGLLQNSQPEKCKKNSCSVEKLENIFWSFRLPILLAIAVSFSLFFLLTKKLLGNTGALFAISLVSLSPILLGMSRIVNPDAFLWMLSILSILSFLISLHKKKKYYLYSSGILMGLALLTKYVANILFIFILLTVFMHYIFNKKNITNLNNYLKIELKNYLIFIIISLSTFTLLYPAVWAKPSRLLKGTIFSQAFISIWQLFLGLLLFMIIDTFVFKNIILKNILNFIAKHQQLFKKILAGILLLTLTIIFYTVYFNESFIDFAKILSSPKSSYRKTDIFSFFMTNFYPLIFGISPLAIFPIIYFSFKIIFNRKINISTNLQNIFFYFLTFIFIYYIGGTLGRVASTIRYQIILYPFIFIMSAIALTEITYQIKYPKKYALNFILIIILTTSLFQIKPFYLSYASALLPTNKHIDYKGMGLGTYEVAQYLNSLPNSENLKIWSDKKGVCQLTDGFCYSEINNFKKAKTIDFDFYVVSADRQAKVTKLTQVRIRGNSIYLQRFDKLYTSANFDWQLKLGNRASNYVRVFNANKIDIVK